MKARDDGDDPCDLGDVEVKIETAKAILVVDPDGEEFWVPKSCLADGNAVFKKGDEGVLIVKTWFARNNNLI